MQSWKTQIYNMKPQKELLYIRELEDANKWFKHLKNINFISCFD
jgi:hypothetical protein